MKQSATQSAGKRVNHRRKKPWYGVVAVLACVVMLCTTYVLIAPAFTLEQGDLELPKHVHSEACYDESGALICALGEDSNGETDSLVASNDANDGEQADETGTQPEESQDEEVPQLSASDDTIVGNIAQTIDEIVEPDGTADRAGGNADVTGALKVQLLYSDKKTPSREASW